MLSDSRKKSWARLFGFEQNLESKGSFLNVGRESRTDVSGFQGLWKPTVPSAGRTYYFMQS